VKLHLSIPGPLRNWSIPGTEYLFDNYSPFELSLRLVLIGRFTADRIGPIDGNFVIEHRIG